MILLISCVCVYVHYALVYPFHVFVGVYRSIVLLYTHFMTVYISQFVDIVYLFCKRA